MVLLEFDDAKLVSMMKNKIHFTRNGARITLHPALAENETYNFS